MIGMEIKPDGAYLDAMRLVEEWEDRMAAIAIDLPYKIAMQVLEDVEKRIPSDAQWKPYRDSLRIAKVSGLPKGEGGFAVYSNLIRRTVRDVDGAQTVLYVQARRRLKRVPPSVLVLERFSPWTLSMLPFLPKQRDARVWSRRVRRREAERVEKDRKRDERKWRDALSKAGFREVDKNTEKKFARGVETVPDLAFEALRMEFGLGDVHLPHWRPALKKIALSLRKFGTDSHLVRTFSDPSYRGWETPQGDSARTIAQSELARFEAFQKALRVRF